MDIIDFLNNYFKEKRITQKQIESMTGIRQDKVSLVLNRKRKLTADELVKIIVIFNINLDELKKILSIGH